MYKRNYLKEPYTGTLVCPLQKKITRFGNMVQEEEVMFCKVKVYLDRVDFPEGGGSTDIHPLNELATNSGITLQEAIASFIQKNPVLLKTCKKNRIGYTSTQEDLPSPTSSQADSIRKERSFVISILKKKKDWQGLKEYTSKK